MMLWYEIETHVIFLTTVYCKTSHHDAGIPLFSINSQKYKYIYK